MTAETPGAASTLRLPLRTLTSPVNTFTLLRDHPTVAIPLLCHLVGALVLSAAVAARSVPDVQARLLESGIGNAGLAAGAVAALLGFLGALLMMGTLGVTAVVAHVGTRIAGSGRDFRETTSVFLVATTPVWIRNLLLGAVLALPVGDLLVQRVSTVRYGDPFLLASGVLLFIGLRQVHGLGRVSACLITAIVTAGGVLVGSGAFA